MREEQMHALLSRRARELGKTFKDLAADAGLARTYLYKLLAGNTHDPSIRTLIRLADAFEVSPILLFRHFGLLHGPPCPGAQSPEFGTRAQGNIDSGDAIEFIADVSIPDHSLVHAGEVFQKVWQVQNVGTVRWRKRRLVRVDDEYVIARRQSDGNLVPLALTYLASLSNAVNVPDTSPGDTANIAVDFASPPASCSVASIWRMEHDTGTPCFQHQFFLQVIVTVVEG